MPDYLAIYLNDHLSGATAGVALARRIAARDDVFARAVRPIAAEIEQDRVALEGLIERLGIRKSRVKIAASRLAERVGRLKLNGHLLSTSPLTHVEEIEMLSLGVEGKTALWRAVRVREPTDSRIDAAHLDRLIERARSQRERLEELRLRAAAEALAGTPRPVT